MFRIQHPETPDTSSALERQQEQFIKTQLKKIETLRWDRAPSELVSTFNLCEVTRLCRLFKTFTLTVAIQEHCNKDAMSLSVLLIENICVDNRCPSVSNYIAETAQCRKTTVCSSDFLAPISQDFLRKLTF